MALEPAALGHTAPGRQVARAPVVVRASRGGYPESRHTVHAVLCDATGAIRTAWGDADIGVFARSAVKPLQAHAVLAAGAFDAFGFGAEEIALACASHGGEPEHVAVAGRALDLCGASPDDLACGAHEPMHAPSARALAADGLRPDRIHNNCSGKHAAMIALARHLGAPVRGYEAPDHPVQGTMSAEIERWTGIPAERLEKATDGCGVVTFRLPLATLAAAFGRFGAAEDGSKRIRDAVSAHPHLLAGTGRLCTAIARHTGGRVLAKVGAEGVYCACAPEAGLGLALKVADGSRRAADAALVSLLRACGVIDAAGYDGLAAIASPPVRDTRGEVVGALEVDLPGTGSGA
ncbi:MAG TPA: asparaginase [Longimicrobiales bacterium]|nr:asparaginase [Longimicrobiales bacterium]